MEAQESHWAAQGQNALKLDPKYSILFSVVPKEHSSHQLRCRSERQGLKITFKITLKITIKPFPAGVRILPVNVNI